MTTPKPKVVPAAQHWEPYPDLPPEPRDMEQMPAAHYLREMLQYVLTPGVQYPHHPTVLIGDQIPIYYGPARPGGGPPARPCPKSRFCPKSPPTARKICNLPENSALSRISQPPRSSLIAASGEPPMTTAASPDIVPRLAAVDRRVADSLEAVLSENTRRTYDTQWCSFDDWRA